MTQTPPAQPRSIPGPPLAWLLLGVATVLRFYHLGHQSLWVDEYASLLSSHPYVPLGWADLWENLHGPLHALSLHLLVNWIGLNTVTLRLPTAVAGVLTVAAMFRLGER
ncbi:MAG TPA: hypothetical protein VMS93_02150, partial [Candidatus Saccharimonadales bacterium]|nr:hypothetical protein [Candidatus Saccharimonadales bacterium]